MRSVVVYESVFGNTQDIAHRVAMGISAYLDVDVIDVRSAPREIGDEIELLVVGGPTHAFGMSRPWTRSRASSFGSARPVPVDRGLREWLAALQHGQPVHAGCAGAAFDTRTGPRWVPGSAARGIEARLMRRGFRVIATAETFWLAEPTGPPCGGELQRAQAWGDRLGRQLISDHAERSWSSRPGHLVL